MRSEAPLTIIISVIVACILLTGTFSAGILVGTNLPAKAQSQQVSLQSSTESTLDSPAEHESLFTPFWEAWDLVHAQYYKQTLEDEILMQGAIRGMMDALGDQHSSYMDPSEFSDATASISGEYTGIGAWVSIDGEYLTIVEPMKGSPAEKADLQPGDQIIAIDGEDMTGVLPELARKKVLGPKGTLVRLTILRERVEEPFEVEIQRDDAIIGPSVEAEVGGVDDVTEQILDYRKKLGISTLIVSFQQIGTAQPSARHAKVVRGGGDASRAPSRVMPCRAPSSRRSRITTSMTHARVAEPARFSC